MEFNIKPSFDADFMTISDDENSDDENSNEKELSTIETILNLREKDIETIIYFNPNILETIKNPSKKMKRKVEKKLEKFVILCSSYVKYINNPSTSIIIQAIVQDPNNIAYIRKGYNLGDNILFMRGPLNRKIVEKRILEIDENDRLDISTLCPSIFIPKNYIEYLEVKNIEICEENGEKICKCTFKGDITKQYVIPDELDDGYSMLIYMNAEYIKDIKIPTKFQQLSAVLQNDGSSIKYIEQPCFETQIASVAICENNIKYIKNPCKFAKYIARVRGIKNKKT